MYLPKQFAAVSLAIALAASTNVLAAKAVDITLTANDITSPVLAWSWGVSNSGTIHVGSGAGAGKANIQDMSLTRYIDAQSPDFVMRVATGEHFDKVILKPGAIKFELEEVLVTSYSTGSSAGETSPTENISLNFAKIRYEVNGKKFCFDVAENTECE